MTTVKALKPVAVLIGRQKWMPKLLPQIVATDRFLVRVSGGRLTLPSIGGLPVLFLHVVGRKSGIERSTPLVYSPYDGRYLIAGSNFGGEKPPVWVFNLEANPEAKVVVRGRTIPVKARIVEGEERARMWESLVETWPNYALYEKRTDRRIKVFVLEPTTTTRATAGP
jgi:deazaflavin-dependent oxidoreductase (nitroreductase family)